MSIDLSPFGFRKTPFTRELAVSERFALPHQIEVADALAEAVHQRMSAALIAPAGTGKTVALRMLVAGLPEARYQVRYVKVTGLSKRDLCREIAAVCGLTPTGIYQVAMAQRLSHYATLRLLSRDETRAYVEHRCAVAGATADPFDDDAYEALFDISHGNLRALDRLALKALERAAHTGATAVSTGDVLEARKGLAP